MPSGRSLAVLFLALVPAGSALAAQRSAPAQASPAPAHAAAPSAPAAANPVRLADLGWLAGTWSGEEEGALSEETWSKPEGDTMLGMWRLVAGGRAKVLEILLLHEDAEGVSLLLRHFDARLVAREEKNKPLVLRLASSGPRAAAFEGPAVADYGGTVRIAYESPSPDSLVSTLERAGKRHTFRFTRRK